MRKVLPVLFWVALVCVAVVLLTELSIYLQAEPEITPGYPYEISLVRGSAPHYTTERLSMLYSSIKYLYIPVFLIFVLFIIERFNLHKELKQEHKDMRKHPKSRK
ncbi:MAG: hypothetical protein ABIE94_06160 [archaeon]